VDYNRHSNDPYFALSDCLDSAIFLRRARLFFFDDRVHHPFSDPGGNGAFYSRGNL
jgi:hypothetical protein